MLLSKGKLQTKILRCCKPILEKQSYRFHITIYLLIRISWWSHGMFEAIWRPLLEVPLVYRFHKLQTPLSPFSRLAQKAERFIIFSGMDIIVLCMQEFMILWIILRSCQRTKQVSLCSHSFRVGKRLTKDEGRDRNDWDNTGQCWDFLLVVLSLKLML